MFFKIVLHKILILQIISVHFVFGLGQIVQLPTGRIRGRKDVTTTGKPFFSFQGIPYATPPIGNLRFEEAIPPQPWKNVFDASKDVRAICHQTPTDSPFETEDCLYVNVYTPQLPSNCSNKMLPVMFYIFGGKFNSGDCTITSYGPQFFLDYDVIIVAVSSRLGPFGFISCEDTTIPGNNGLKDQLLAMKWTKANIHLFGGDPEKITIFGHSSGSMSIGYHLLQLNSKGLFSRALMQSGSSLSPSSFTRFPRAIAFKTASYLNETFTTSNDSKALLEFLRTVPAQDLDHAANRYINEMETLQNQETFQGLFWAPVLEPEHKNAFITKRMYVQFKSGDILKVPLLIGITSEEGLAYGADRKQFHEDMHTLDAHLNWIVPHDMRITDEAKGIETGKKIRAIYTNNGTAFAKNLTAGIKLYSDNDFNRGVVKHAEYQSNVSDVYFYQFSYDGPLQGPKVYYKGAGKVAHTGEINYLWFTNTSATLDEYPESDQLNHKRLLKIWTDFAKYGNPTPYISKVLDNIIWPKVDIRNFFYVDIGNNLTIQQHPKAETCYKWDAIYDSLNYDDFITY